MNGSGICRSGVASAAAIVMLAAGLAQGQRAATGTLQFRIVDRKTAQPLPGKLVFLQNGKPVELGIRSEGAMASRGNTIYTANGEGTVRLPAGAYEVWAGRGMEYSADVQQLIIAPEGQTNLVAKLQREVDTRGFVGGDLHLHTLTYSGHGDANVQERLISCLGEGLEWAVATDHNHVTDYGPIGRELGVESRMLTSIGNEVSTPIGHFNAFPLPAAAPAVAHEVTNANQLFKLIREQNAGVVIQVNHPRWPGAAYFTEMDLDPLLAKTGDSNWSWDFDALEILNENRGLGWIAEADNPVSVREDWFNLLNSGRQFTAVGNSDSHDVVALLAGIPRNYVASGSDDPSQLDESELVQNLKQRRVTVARGLFVEMTANGNVPIGGRTPLRDGQVALHIRVQAPHWIQCDTVEIIANGDVTRTFAVKGSSGPVRFERTIVLRPQSDTWYIAVASGSQRLAPLYHDAPVPITPLGFTNPIWVDADGDGRFTSLREQAEGLVNAYRGRPQALVRHVKNEPHLLRLAAAVVGERVSGSAQETATLAALLPFANLEGRLLIYRQLARGQAAAALPVLHGAAAIARGPRERMAVAFAQYQLGEDAQWPVLASLMKSMAGDFSARQIISHLSPRQALRRWQIVGPFQATGDTGLDRAYPPEQRIDFQKGYHLTPEHEVYWRTFEAPASGVVDLNEIFGEHEYSVAYAFTTLHAREAGEIVLLLGSDDGVVAWLNGVEMHRHHVHRQITPGEDTVVLSLRPGPNELLLKIANRARGWGFIGEVVDPMHFLK